MWQPAQFGSIRLRNRLVMAPLTRTRANDDGAVTELIAEYYRQRATAGLIVSEGTWPTLQGKSYLGQPGIADTAHVDAWRQVTGAVHSAGGSIVLQLMHGGRVAHPAITRREVVAPSAVRPPGHVRTASGKQRFPVPEAMTRAAIAELPLMYAKSARRAISAGFDGVELHAANGYLLHQFLAANTNLRGDEYGLEAGGGRRVVTEVAQAVVDEVGADRVGIRLSPGNNVQGIDEDYQTAADGCRSLALDLRPLGLAYISLVWARPGDSLSRDIGSAAQTSIVVNTGPATATTREEARAVLDSGAADAVAVGRAFIANPDLARRWAEGRVENHPDQATFYVGGPRGYTDYGVLPG
ncbi:alkene reductase [Ruicaihuangia caeni]